MEVIREAVPTDAGGIRECVKAAYEHYIERMGKPPGPMVDDYDHVVANHHVAVAERAGEIVGAVVVIERTEGPLLDNVAVHPSMQGKGLGKQLIEHAHRVAISLGATKIDLYTHELMTENIGMYEAMGYFETHRILEKGYARVYMRKALTK